MAQKLTTKPNKELKKKITQHKIPLQINLVILIKQGILYEVLSSDSYLPEKKIPSIHAKATSLSANEVEL